MTPQESGRLSLSPDQGRTPSPVCLSHDVGVLQFPAPFTFCLRHPPTLASGGGRSPCHSRHSHCLCPLDPSQGTLFPQPVNHVPHALCRSPNRADMGGPTTLLLR